MKIIDKIEERAYSSVRHQTDRTRIWSKVPIYTTTTRGVGVQLFSISNSVTNAIKENSTLPTPARRVIVIE